MIQLALPQKSTDALSILCLGAHSDDIEIGCGATLLKLKETYPSARFHWVVFCASGVRGNEAANASDLFIADHEREVILNDFRDGFLPHTAVDVKSFFEKLKGQVNPDLIFTHWQGDAHQDHRLISELTWNTFRNHTILEYEIPKYDGDMGRPNVFVRLEKQHCEQKISHLFTAFESQRTKAWFDRDTFMGLMRIRGMESNASSGYAEAFYARKIVLGL